MNEHIERPENGSSVEELCVFTPTFNRAYTLEALFHSLMAQTVKEFRWLVVDDGSTDGTQELIGQLAARADFRVDYVRQDNGGKQRAHNTAVKQCENELFVCVDSDDLLTPYAVEAILDAWPRFRGDPHVAGMVGLCGTDAGTPLGNSMPAGVDRTTFWDLYYKRGHQGDSVCVHRTEVLKEFPFFVAPGEKFMAEPYVYHQIDQHYDLGVIDQVLIVREYLPDGYTHNVRAVTKSNPIGYMTLKRMYIEYSDTFRLKFENSILYLVGCRLSHTPHGVRRAPNIPIALMAWLPAQLLCATVYR